MRKRQEGKEKRFEWAVTCLIELGEETWPPMLSGSAHGDDI